MLLHREGRDACTGTHICPAQGLLMQPTSAPEGGCRALVALIPSVRLGILLVRPRHHAIVVRHLHLRAAASVRGGWGGQGARPREVLCAQLQHMERGETAIGITACVW